MVAAGSKRALEIRGSLDEAHALSAFAMNGQPRGYRGIVAAWKNFLLHRIRGAEKFIDFFHVRETVASRRGRKDRIVVAALEKIMGAARSAPRRRTFRPNSKFREHNCRCSATCS